MAMIRTANPASSSLGPYVFAFVVGAIALSDPAKARKVERDQANDNASARAALVDKLLDRLAGAYRAGA